jgi:DNA-binding MarR family transcriptional regulator
MGARRKPTSPAQAAPFAYEGLDRVLHEKARLGILTALLTRAEGLLFNDLKELCALTDGNLSRHVRLLEDAGLVEVWKGFRERRPQTLIRLNPRGRAAFLAYLEQLEQVIEDAKRRPRTVERFAAPEGWVPA